MVTQSLMEIYWRAESAFQNGDSFEKSSSIHPRTAAIHRFTACFLLWPLVRGFLVTKKSPPSWVAIF
jgi:hypothetical protein